MNRLKYMQFYTAGPMQYQAWDKGIAWRDKVKAFLSERKAFMISPLDKPTTDLEVLETDEDRNFIARLKENEDYDELRRIMKKVVRSDLRISDNCAGTIAQIDTSIHTCGTYHEIVNASNQHKPIMLFVNGGKNKAPDWIYGIVPHQTIFGSLDDLLAHLDRVDRNCETPEELKVSNRWVFLNYEKIL